MRKIIWITLIIFLGLSGLAFGQTAKDALESLKQIEVKIETGVSYEDYPQVLAKAQKEVNMFLKSNEAKKNPGVTKDIKAALDYYVTANKIWDIKFTCKDDYVMEAIGINTKCGIEIKKLYYKSKAELLPRHLGPFYIVSHVLRNIFYDASKEIKKASELLTGD
jgi:hypothetical protein